MEQKDYVKRNFGATLKDLQGEDILNPLRMGPGIFQRLTAELDHDARQKVADALNRLKQRPLTLAEACIEALLAPTEGGEKKSQAERLGLMRLAQRINRGGMAKITAAERDQIKAAVYAFWNGNLIPTQCDDLLEGREALVMDPGEPAE